MHSTTRSSKPGGDKQLPLLVLVTGASLVAAMCIQLLASGAFSQRAIRSHSSMLTLIELGGGLVGTLLLTGMARALVRANRVLAASESDARELLRLQSQRFHALEREGWDGVIILDLMAGIRWIGVTAARILRLDPNEVMGASLLGLVDVRNMDAFLAALAIEKGETRKPFEFQMRDADGRTRWFEAVTSNHSDDESVAGVIMHFRDATERRKTQKFLSDRDRFVRAAFDDSPFGAATLNAEGRVVQANAALAAIAGRTQRALAGKGVGTIVSPRDRAAVSAAMRKAREAGDGKLNREVTLASGLPGLLALTPIGTDGEGSLTFAMQIVVLPVSHETSRAEPRADQPEIAAESPTLSEDPETPATEASGDEQGDAVIALPSLPIPEVNHQPLDNVAIPEDAAETGEGAPHVVHENEAEPTAEMSRPIELGMLPESVFRAIVGARRSDTAQVDAVDASREPEESAEGELRALQL